MLVRVRLGERCGRVWKYLGMHLLDSSTCHDVSNQDFPPTQFKMARALGVGHRRWTRHGHDIEAVILRTIPELEIKV